MGRFLSYVIFFTIGTGLILHFDLALPWWGAWMGNLPGDLLLKKGKLVIYIPLATSVLISVAMSVLAFLFSSKEK